MNQAPTTSRVVMYRGKLLSEMTKEELLEVIQVLDSHYRDRVDNLLKAVAVRSR